MSTAALAVFVFVAFLAPVPLLHWLDRVPHGPSSTMDSGDPPRGEV